MAHKWFRIQDLELGEDLASQELASLALVWNERRRRLVHKQAFTRFEEQLKREWAIETGLIERLYSLGHRITRILIECGIDGALLPHGSIPKPEATIAMIKDQEAALEAVFHFIEDDRRLSTSYIKELHGLITRHQFTAVGIDIFGRRSNVRLIRGDYKRFPNNPTTPDGSIHEYCPPVHVAQEMDRLIEMHHGHADIAPETQAAWLHHRFTQIHPFQDGNGRVARALATMVFIEAGWLPLVVRDRERRLYIAALEDADRGDLKPLVDFFARLQRDEMIRALNLATSVIATDCAEDETQSM